MIPTNVPPFQISFVVDVGFDVEEFNPLQPFDSLSLAVAVITIVFLPVT